ncbi:MAG TPA: peptidoglycan DD-metalloendopeptidase family protein [Geminicoccaceae bacterium]|nr:peptidoglycan DD-metalloendopeptidase family protein [Geminicoccaceae bacterium]
MGQKARCGLLCAAIAAAVAAGPGSLLAATSPAETSASLSRRAELSDLDQIRERLARRRVLQQGLDQRVASLALEIATLEARQEQAWATLRHERDEARALARRLDHLVPRVLARQAAVQQRREQAARMLADLASTSRGVELDPTIRARMLAISPVVLRRLQSAESSLSVLERQPDRLLARHEEIERRAPLLIAEAERLQSQGEETERQRQIVSARLEQVTAEVEQLSHKQQLAVRRVLPREVAQSAHAGPKSDQPALPEPARAAVLDAAVKGLLAERPQRAFAVHAVQPAASRLVAIARGSSAPTRAAAVAYAGLAAVPPPPAKPLDRLLEGGLHGAAQGALAGVDGVTPQNVALLQPGPLAAIDMGVAPARIGRAAAPIIPIPGEVANPFGELGGAELKPGLGIVAAPGQAVTAPQDGRIVFAGPFKSYGLLLIIEHQREYHTLLWGFSRLDVTIGDPVRNGQIIGVMAADAEHPARLHVELRRNGRPVNPLPWLAASSNKVRG